MHDIDGVIQFTLQHSERLPLDNPVIAELAQCHSDLHKLGLIARDSLRYGGYAFGNMSARIDSDKFIISGSQTGGQAELGPSDYCLVESCNIEQNNVISCGPIKPSSECMTHAAIYSATEKAKAVVHVHSPLIWKNYQQLALYSTGPNITYGTPEMAEAVSNCIEEMGDVSHGSIAMLGHEDGIITFAECVKTATEITIKLLEQASSN